MRQEEIDRIIAKSLDSVLSEKESKLLADWVDLDPKNLDTLQGMQDIFNSSFQVATDSEEAERNSWHQLNDLIDAELEQHPTKRNIFSLWTRIAASLLIIVVFTFLIANQFGDQKVTFVNDTNSIEEIELIDGSIVMLKPASSLTLSKKFNIDNREMSLEGEAYFIVAKNEDLRFQIQGGNAITSAIGTEFILRAYPAIGTSKVFVTEGTVKVAFADQEKILTEQQFATWQTSGAEIEVINSLALPHNEHNRAALIFDNEPLVDVCQILSSYYALSFELSESVKTKPLSTKFLNADKQTVLDVISKTLSVEIKEENGKVIIR